MAEGVAVQPEQLLTRQQLNLTTEALGFDAWGICLPQLPELQVQRHLNWLQRGYGGDMAYLERRPELRFDATSLLPECRSVLALALSYHQPGPTCQHGGSGKLSRYAWGDDYHDIMGEKLRQLGSQLKLQDPGLKAKACVDTSPLAEKGFAVQAGLGWPARNSLVLNPRLGTYFFIGLLLLSAELEPDPPLTQDCGTCTLCIRACPTEALSGPGILNATRCVSYLTTERRDPVEAGDKLSGWLYGCDTCQEVCPFNAGLPPTREAGFAARPASMALSAEAALAMDAAAFDLAFEGTVIKRRRLERVQAQARNLLAAGMPEPN